jgi:hypothetical protein
LKTLKRPKSIVFEKNKNIKTIKTLKTIKK